MKYHYLRSSRDSSVGIVNTLRDGQQTHRGSIPGRSKRFNPSAARPNRLWGTPNKSIPWVLRAVPQGHSMRLSFTTI
jgi:hypothetical protein